MKRTGRSSRFAMGLIVVVVFFICALIFYKKSSLQSTLNSKQDELAAINGKISEAEEETEIIKNEIKYRETDDYIEDQARDSLGLRYPDEIILVPSENGE